MKKPAFTSLRRDTLQLFAKDNSVETIAAHYGKTKKAIYKRMEKVHQHFGCTNSLTAYRLALLSNKMELK